MQDTAVAPYSVMDYSQPIVTTTETLDPNSEPATQAVSESEQAREAFRAGDYPRALAAIDAALGKTPRDTVLHEFRALILFAMQKYKDAAATLYAVLSVGSGWDWTTMSGLYPDTDTYTGQLRTLESYVKQTSDAPDGHFVLAYHYMTAGNSDEARKQLEEVVRLVPNDQVSKQLLDLITPAEKASPSGERENPPKAKEQATQTGPSSLVGKWSAPAPGGGKVDLSLTDDASFKWSFARGDKSQTFDGKYRLDGSTLVLEYANGGSMVGKVSAEGSDRFSFKMIGGPPNDPGLSFNK
ncbi:MAG TPA: tetratricopeptide repeat protein [Planctomycetaceae bacterium]|nr:tetratricopeptide repeat protein [Planctomycetaceae bacterium]